MKKVAKAHKLNKTSNFILPLVGYSFSFFKPFLHNAYIGDTCISRKYPYCVYILLKFSGHKQFSIVEKTLLGNARCKSHYDLHGGSHVMFILEVPKKYKDDYSLLVSGKYSKISSEAKDLILEGRTTVQNTAGKVEFSLIHKILHKDEELKQWWEKRVNANLNEQEVWSILHSMEEVFSPSLMDNLERKKKIEHERERSPGT